MDTTENIIRGKAFEDWWDDNYLILDEYSDTTKSRAAFMAGWQAALKQLTITDMFHEDD